MRLTIAPFYSQQDKRTGQFLLKTCGARKQLSWLASRIHEELDWSTRVYVPENVGDCAFPWGWSTPNISVASCIPDNAVEQVHWDVPFLRQFFKDADIALLNHELLAIPVRRLFPKLKIVQMCSVRPDTALFAEAWRCADLVVVQSETMAKYVAKSVVAQVSVWPLAFDDGDVAWRHTCERDVDVLFVQRCSVTNYTKHLEFLEAMKLMGNLRVAFTDVTGYLRKQRPELEYSTPDSYYQYLARSKVAVALNDNLAGGLSIREACRAGCTPVVLDAPCYNELVGDDYPYRIFRVDSAIELADVIATAVEQPKRVDVSHLSYQASWPQVKADLEKLACSSR